MNPATIPPLTLSVEGEWGAGKSSFMRLLLNELKEESGKRQQPLAIVQFNAWRSDKEDALWAAFAMEFLRQLAPASWIRRLKAHLTLWRLRYDLKKGWYDALRFLLLLLAVLLIGVNIASYLYANGIQGASAFLFAEKGNPGKFIFGLGGAAGYITLLFVFLRKFREIVGNPFSIHLQRYVNKPNYEEHTAFVETFHRDFAKIVKAYLPNGKAFVFIDDLDRCEVPKAADLMQSLNLLMSAEGAPIVFVLGIDREVIAAGLAAKYAALLPYLTVSMGGASGPVAGLEYGYAFLEKFIQLPFQVPRPRGVDIDKLLDSLGAEPVATPSEPDRKPTRPDLLEVVLDKDSPRVRKIIRAIAPPLEYNPRRLKQFVNLFRLKTFIASETGLFGEPDKSAFAPLTLEMLGKMVALSLRWPRLLTVLVGRPRLLSALQRSVWGQPLRPGEELDTVTNDQLAYWLSKPRLVDLLRLPFTNEGELQIYRRKPTLNIENDGNLRGWSLDLLDVERLLETSPRKKAASPAASPTVSAQSAPSKQRNDSDVDDDDDLDNADSDAQSMPSSSRRQPDAEEFPARRPSSKAAQSPPPNRRLK